MILIYIHIFVQLHFISWGCPPEHEHAQVMLSEKLRKYSTGRVAREGCRGWWANPLILLPYLDVWLCWFFFGGYAMHIHLLILSSCCCCCSPLLFLLLFLLLLLLLLFLLLLLLLFLLFLLFLFLFLFLFFLLFRLLLLLLLLLLLFFFSSSSSWLLQGNCFACLLVIRLLFPVQCYFRVNQPSLTKNFIMVVTGTLGGESPLKHPMTASDTADKYSSPFAFSQAVSGSIHFIGGPWWYEDIG